MDITQMRMMLVLAENKSLTTTAKKLHVTQPALTYQLKVIENELGFKVFDRTRTGTTLTEEGAFLRESLKDIVQKYDEAVRLTRAMAKGATAGTVRVGINDCSRDTTSFLLNYSQSNISFSFVPCGSSDPIKLLHDRVIDFWSASDAVLRDPLLPVRFLELSSSGQSVFVPTDHPLASKSSLRTKSLETEKVWLWPRGSVSTGANRLRDELERCDARLEDLKPGSSTVSDAFDAGGIVVYDDGFLPPLSYAAAQIPLTDVQRDILGLVYLPSQEDRLAPIIESLKASTSLSRSHTVSASELAAERIMAVLTQISDAVQRGCPEDVEPLVEYGLDLGISAHHMLNRGLLSGMNSAEESFRAGNTEMAQMKASMATANLAMEMLQPRFAEEEEQLPSGSAAIGTVLGDQHDMGKQLVRIMLESRNIEVADLGVQIPPEGFVDYLHDHKNCNLILISVSNTDVLSNVRKTMEALAKAKLRDQVFVMVGGSAITPSFAEEIGADAYTLSAEDAAEKATELLRLYD